VKLAIARRRAEIEPTESLHWYTRKNFSFHSLQIPRSQQKTQPKSTNMLKIQQNLSTLTLLIALFVY
ncbi:MAG: hypothetical protein O2V44_07790, partial [Candidatus Bathyarchaeota archaeon]|nr:hypothetical protein [Candidatus Bathyarchaeota archaeon]